MSKLRTYKSWGLVSKNDTQEITIEKNCKSVSEFKELCKNEGITLTSEPYSLDLPIKTRSFDEIMNSDEGTRFKIQAREERILELTENIKTASEYMKGRYSLTINAYKQEIKELKSQLS